MNIFLTYDYELFFGASTGSVDKCLIEPTNRLLMLSEKFQIKMTFFVDVGYLIQLEKFADGNPELIEDQIKVNEQIKRIIATGNAIQLHIHPHWEKSTYSNKKWKIVTDNAYKLADFPAEEIASIVRKYKAYLDNLIGYKTTSYRAGGWCIQPFSIVKDVFKELNLTIDSSVFPGGKFSSHHYSFDFTKAPNKSKYRFESDECVEDENGFFTEYPISSYRYSPLFYWRLYILGRLFPAQHKMLGDGLFLAQPGRKKSVLTAFTWNHVSTDGYYASKLNAALNDSVAQGKTDMVVIGHPKGMTEFSFKKLETFISSTHKKETYLSFNNLL